MNSLSELLKKTDEDHLKTVHELKVAMLTGMTGNIGIAQRFDDGYRCRVYANEIMEKSFDMREFAEKILDFLKKE